MLRAIPRFENLIRSDPFEHIRGINKGEVGFIAASGPSLRHIDSKKFEDKTIIAVNGSFLKFKNQNPYYFTCDGRVVFKYHWQEVKYSYSPVVVNLAGAGSQIFLWGGILDTSRIYYYSEKREDKKFLDTDSSIISASNSTIAAVHFAHILGCSPIILLGVDCCYEEGKKYYNDFEGQPKDGWHLNVSDPPAVDEDKSSDGYLHLFQNGWKEIAEINNHIEILNASGGILDCFPKVNWEDYV